MTFDVLEEREETDFTDESARTLVSCDQLNSDRIWHSNRRGEACL